MKIIIKILKYTFVMPEVMMAFLWKKMSPILPAKLYLKVLFRLRHGYWMDFNNPSTFNEKLQWLKLYDRRPEYIKLVDKYEAKKVVADIIGEQYIIPTLGVWENVEDIDFDKLPNQFVLKCTHDSGGLVICKDKKMLDIEAAKNKINKCLNTNYYNEGKEWPYKKVPRRIIAEEFINPAPNVKDLPDYKWYCFNGEPLYCQVIQNRSTEETIDFFDAKWEHQSFIGLNQNVNHAPEVPKCPRNLKKQIEIAKKLSSNMPFSRIDIYEVDNDVFWGEITLYPASGMGAFSPGEYDKKLGEMIKLPTNKKRG